MWTTAELKSQARATLRGRYWESVGTVLIYGVIIVFGPALFAWIPVLGFFISMAFTFFVANPLQVGLCYFFMQNRLAPPVVGNLFAPFGGERYMKIVGAKAWKTLFLFLWALIPAGIAAIGIPTTILSGSLAYGGYRYDTSWIAPLTAFLVIYLASFVIVLIKSLAYSLTEYILSDNPNIPYDRVLKLSIAMTYGNKWRIFVLYLSFIGWYLLSLLTLNIGMIFLTPYVQATLAELYVKLRDEAIRNGLTTPQELGLVIYDPNTPQNPPCGSPYNDSYSQPGSSNSQPYGGQYGGNEAGAPYTPPPLQPPVQSDAPTDGAADGESREDSPPEDTPPES